MRNSYIQPRVELNSKIPINRMMNEGHTVKRYGDRDVECTINTLGVPILTIPRESFGTGYRRYFLYDGVFDPDVYGLLTMVCYDPKYIPQYFEGTFYPIMVIDNNDTIQIASTVILFSLENNEPNRIEYRTYDNGHVLPYDFVKDLGKTTRFIYRKKSEYDRFISKYQPDEVTIIPEPFEKSEKEQEEIPEGDRSNDNSDRLDDEYIDQLTQRFHERLRVLFRSYTSDTVPKYVPKKNREDN